MIQSFSQEKLLGLFLNISLFGCLVIYSYVKGQVKIAFVCMRSAEEIDAIKNYIANLGQNYVFSV